jgi:peptidoglycan/xylan/chitin deacetylase (PgdA/CDA1 family)
MHALTLLYHDVVPPGRPEVSGFQSPDADIYKLTVDEFDRQLAAIAASAPVPPTTAATDLSSAKPSERPVFITFDDGGASGSLYIADMLERRGWIGHFFVTTDYIGAPGFMDAGALRDLQRRGHVLGSHSASHPARISTCTARELDREWTGSARRLAEVLGAPVLTASVPGGYYSSAVGAAAARAGYRVLFTSEPVTRVYALDGCLIVGRFGVQQGVPPSWTAAVIRGARWPRASRYLAWNAKKVLKTVGGDSWLRARRWIVAARAR